MRWYWFAHNITSEREENEPGYGLNEGEILI